MKKLLLVDGHSILNRAYYGLPPLTAPDGTPTGAVYGFLNILLRFFNEEKPDYLAVAFDLSAPTFRHKMYPDYKGTRKSMDDDLRVQVPIIKDVLSAMDITIVTKEGFEADDIIGTLAKKNASYDLEVVIVSGDKDLLQLADDHISMMTPKTSKGVTTVTHYTPEKIKEEFGVEVSEFVLLKAIMGDTSDNIPGVKGVGPKTAAPIVSEYHTLESVIENIDNISSASVRNKMREGVDSMKMSFDLALIDTDVPLDVSLEDVRVKNFNTPASFELFKKYNFKNMLAGFTEEEKHDKISLPKIVMITDALRLKETADEFKEVLKKGDSIGLSVEHTEKNDNILAFLNGDHPTGIALAKENDKVYYASVSGDITGEMIEECILSLAAAKKDSEDCYIYINDIKAAAKGKGKMRDFPLYHRPFVRKLQI